MKVGLCTIAVRDKLLVDALQLANDIGFDGVEIWGREPHMGASYDRARARGARRMAEERGLEIPMFGSYLRLGKIPRSGETENTTVADAANTTRSLGTKLCRVWAGEMGSEEASREYRAQVVDETAAACEAAAELGITLVVEMHAGTLTDTSQSTVALLRDVGAPNLAVNYQCSSGSPPEDPYERLQTVLPHVVNVHAQNCGAMTGDPDTRPERVGLAQGVVDYQRLASALAESGFNGYIEVEFTHGGNPDREAALRADYEFLRRLCE